MPLGYDVTGVPRAPDPSAYGRFIASSGLSAGDMVDIQRQKRLDEERAKERELLAARQLKEDAINSQELAMRKDELGLRRDRMDMDRDASQLDIDQRKADRLKAQNQEYMGTQGIGALPSYAAQDDQPWLGKVPFKDLSDEQKGIVTGYAQRGNVKDITEIPSLYEGARLAGGNFTEEEKKTVENARAFTQLRSQADQMKAKQDIALAQAGMDDLNEEQSTPPSAPAQNTIEVDPNDADLQSYNSDLTEINSLLGKAPAQSAPQASGVKSTPPAQLTQYSRSLAEKKYPSLQAFAQGEGLSLDQAKAIVDGIRALKSAKPIVAK